MKSIKYLLTFSAFAIIFSCSAQTAEQIHEQKWTTYENKTVGMTFSYPAHWDTTAQDSRIVFMAAEVNEDTSDLFNENLNLSIAKGNGSSLTEVLDQNFNAVKAQFGDLPTLKRGELTNAKGVDLGYITFIHETHGLELNHYSYFFTDGDLMYCLTIGGEEKKDNIYRILRDEIVQSIKLGLE